LAKLFPLRLALAWLLCQTLEAPAVESRAQFESAGGGPKIEGYLSIPPGRGPFPAVVLIHSCLGLPANRSAIEGALNSWGYVALFVDSFGLRGLRETCSVDFPDAVRDAFGALAYLARRPEVDPSRVAAVGYSQGGDAALRIASAPSGEPFGLPHLSFKAAAALYPPCDNVREATMAVPTLVLIGASDTVTPAADCERLAQRQPDRIDLVVLPGAAHGFDDPEFGAGKRVLGMMLAYNADAARRAGKELRRFLAETLRR